MKIKITNRRCDWLRKCLVICPLMVLTCHVSAQQLSERYSKEHPLIIACDWDKPPYEFLNDGGKPSGSNVDVLHVILDKLEIPHHFVMKEWSNAIKTFERGDADLIFANINRFKGKQFYSTQIINYNRIRVAMTKDTAGIVSVQTLEQEGVVLKPGEYSNMYFNRNDSAVLSKIEYQSPKVALTGLLSGDNRYFVWGEEPLKWKIRKLNLEGIYLNEVSIPVSEVHIIGRDRELINSIDDQYSRLKQSGDLETMLNKWYHPERVEESTPPVFIYTTLALVLLVALLFFISRLAKRHVRRAERYNSELNEMMYKALRMGNFKLMEYDIRNNRFTNRYGCDLLPDGGMTIKEFTGRIHPDQREEFQEKMQLLMSGREHRFDLNKRWNDGSEEMPHWLNFHGHAILEVDHNGHPAYIVNAIHDVTHEEEEDAADRQIEKKYARLTNMPIVAMSFYDQNGFLYEMNNAMKEICGIRDDNPETKRYWETVCMFDIPLFRTIYSPKSTDDLLVCQHMEYPEMGIDKFIEFNVLPLFNAMGDIVNYYVLCLDLTHDQEHDDIIHRKRREIRETRQQIIRQKERLKYLLINSTRYLMRSNIKEQRIAFYRTPDAPEYVHSYTDFITMLEERERGAFDRLLHDTTTRTTQHFIVHLISRSPGQPGTVFQISFNPVFDESGNIIGHEGISSDMTTLSDAEQQLKELTLQADASVQMKSGFMASMTHELRTPLNAIVGFTGILGAIDSGESRAEYVRIIRNSSDMLQRLINDIIEASSMSDGPIGIEPEDVDFAVSFDDICTTLQQRVQNPDVVFQKDNPYDRFYTSIDIGRVMQVITNFVTNAVKFTKKGYIRVGYRYENHGLHLYCEDTGMGIPKEKQEIIFERFVKLDEFVQGTGMGLAICKSIAERLGGKIGVRSEGEGKGTTFWVWIPCERRLTN